MDGTSVNYVAWAPNEPNFANNDENCVVMYTHTGGCCNNIQPAGCAAWEGYMGKAGWVIILSRLMFHSVRKAKENKL